MCAPKSSPVLPSKTVLTMPPGPPSAIALPLPINGKWPVLRPRDGLSCSLLGEAHTRNLRAAIGAGADVVQIERVHVVDAGDPVDADDHFVAGLVRQPWRADEIADRITPRLADAQPFVDDGISVDG